MFIQKFGDTMKPSIKVSWEGTDPNQVIIDDWNELLMFLCSNKDCSDIYTVEIFEQHCMECINIDTCNVWDLMPY